MTALLVLAGLEVVGFLLVRTHPEIRDLMRSATPLDRFRGNLALLGLWPLLAISLCCERGNSKGGW